jgi:hypothetical protein
MSPDAGDDADTEATDAISIGLLKGFLIDYRTVFLRLLAAFSKY